MDGEPPTVVIQATTWLEVVLALVKLQEDGLGVHLPVNVCCYSTLSMKGMRSIPPFNSCELWHSD